MIAAAHIVQRKRKPTRPYRGPPRPSASRQEAPAQRRQAGARKGDVRLTYDFKIAAADTATMYRDLASALEGLIAGETDAVANMANAAALIWETLARPQLGRLLPQCWRRAGRSGRSRAGRPASASRSARASAALPPKTRQVQRVEDVHAFPGHIACDSASNSEIVVPLVRDGELLGVLDLDSPKHGAVHARRTRPAASGSARSSQRFFSSAAPAARR